MLKNSILLGSKKFGGSLRLLLSPDFSDQAFCTRGADAPLQPPT
mgnify:CR=1 FL=1